MCSSKTEFLDICSSLEPYSDLISSELENVKPTKLFLLEQLKDHDLYFISWLRDETVTKENFKKLWRTLYECVAPITKVDDEDLSELTEQGMTTIQSAGCGLIETFLLIKIRKFGRARSAIAHIQKFLQHCDKVEIISKDYINGFQYMISLLELHLSIADGSVTDSQNVNKAITTFKTTSDFKPVELAAILSARWQLNQIFQARSIEAVEEHGLQKMHELDPENWVWSYLLCTRVRFIRRQYGGGHNSYPDQREIAAINYSVKFAPDHYRPIPVAAVCLSLAEILRWRLFNNTSRDDLIFGEHVFRSNDEIAKFIVETARKALETSEVCFGELIRYGEILSSTMPPKYQDIEVSEDCLEKTLKIDPTNSKANHRMGVFLLTCKKEKPKALTFFRRAVVLAPANYPAWMDFIQTLLSECEDEKKATVLTNIFEDLMEAGSGPKWASLKQRVSLLFLRALYSFFQSNNDDAISDWLELTKISADDSHQLFNDLHRTFKRYSFRRSIHTTLDSIENIISEELQNCTDSGKPTLEVLLKNIADAKGHRQRFYNQSSDNITRSKPIQAAQARPRHPTSEADSDDCWRKSSPAPASASATLQNQSPSSFTYSQSSSPGQFSKYNQGFRPDSANTKNYSGSRDWQQAKSFRGRGRARTPSPDSWRS